MGDTRSSSEFINGFFNGFPEKMSKCFKVIVSRYTSDTQIKPYHMPFINRIGEVAGTSQKDLSCVLPFDKSRVSTVIHELMDMGVVVNDSDGKVSSLRLTESGKNMYAMCQMLKALMGNLILDDFTDDELDELGRLLMKLNHRMDEILEGFEQR